MLKRISFVWKFNVVRFVVFGSGLLVTRLVIFSQIERVLTANNANIISILITTFLAFYVHSKFTWREREGTFIQKATRFGSSIVISAILRSIVYPIVLVFFIEDCSGEELQNKLDILKIIKPMWISCEFLLAFGMDGAFAVLDYFLHDKWSFRKKSINPMQGYSQLAHAEMENWC